MYPFILYNHIGLYIIITRVVNEIFFNNIHMLCGSDNYYDCVRQGLSESYDILYQGDFSEQDVVKFRMYPRFHCDEVEEYSEPT